MQATQVAKSKAATPLAPRRRPSGAKRNARRTPAKIEITELPSRIDTFLMRTVRRTRA